MAKSKSGAHKAGGGIASRVNIEKPVRTGRGARAIIPAGAAQQGNRVGNHITEKGSTSYGGVELYSRGPGYNKAQYGNEVALNVGKGGPRQRLRPIRPIWLSRGSRHTRQGVPNAKSPRALARLGEIGATRKPNRRLTMVEVRLSGKSMDQRIADRLKPSGDPRAEHHTQQGTRPTRVHHFIHNAGHVVFSETRARESSPLQQRHHDEATQQSSVGYRPDGDSDND